MSSTEIMKVFVVEDDPITREIITVSLQVSGHTVQSFENGRKAIEVLAYESADLMITDILMPEMDGVEILREIQRLQPQLPVLAISGGGSLGPTNYLGIAQVFGAAAVLAKPFSPDELIELVAKLLADRDRSSGPISGPVASHD
jgi:two-component system, chemotaxis family, chemotaxis protein CheY